ncbi:tyrosine-type recombinase/integrase (plasmid) [Sinorhizobium meliloti]|nr:tyrosine-type recombinase/integrase [Sinorhizobium meliloti]WQP24184.1 tyrosine-type recombinase/integrase [Sinorhizobium meliloti]
MAGFYSARGKTIPPLPWPVFALPLSPYVYSTEELHRLLAATSILKDGHSPQVPTIYRTLLLLLYGSGMRIGEALRLVLHDVDLSEQIITVRDTKFFKTRLVPIGLKLNCELAAHIERRRLVAAVRQQTGRLRHRSHDRRRSDAGSRP